MTPTPPSTNSSTGVRSPEEQFRVVRKRNRVPLSCYPCRTRKLKCDRGHPCANCVKREGADPSACSYATPASRKKNQNQANTSPDDMQNRIDRLEGLVLSLMHGGANTDSSGSGEAAAAGPGSGPVSASTVDSGSSRMEQDDDGHEVDDESDSDDLVRSLGVLKVDADRGKSLYIGQEHWHTILADISEVRQYFVSHKKDLETSYERVLSSKPATAKEPPTLLIGSVPASEVELRAELPPKSSVLTLCGRYFNSMDNAVNIIHAPTFHAQLRKHWQDPSKTPIMWLGLLYSVLCLAMLSYHKVGDEPAEWKGRSLELAALYRLRTVQCLTAADYTRPVEYTVETMLLYTFGEYSSRWDADLGLWLICSVITRIALRMGYHRDAKWFPSLTPFQGEMRRRTWALVRMSDVIFSHQVSLPSMIQDHDCDTELPSNIFDEEFNPETKVLPSSRPSTEPTPIGYMIAKVQLCIEAGNILQTTNRVKHQVHYDDILKFDSRMQDLKAELPPHLKMRPLDEGNDPLTLIIARYNIDILHHKIVCLLHRKYMSRAQQNPRYAHSRRRAIEASMDMLGHLITLNRESQANGRLRSIKWYVQSIATKDFMLPATILSIEVHFQDVEKKKTGRHDSQAMYFWTPEQREEMIRCLEQTRDIWAELRDGSVEAFKAYNILKIVLEKIGDQSSSPENAPRNQQQQQYPMRTDIFASGSTGELPNQDPVGLGMMPGGLTPNTAALFGTVQSPGGTSYPAIDPALGPAMESSGMTPDFQNDLLTGLNNNPGSPFAMFGSMNVNDVMDFSQNFDWDSLQNFAQSGNFGTDQSFHFFSGGPEQQQQPQTAGSTTDSSGFAFTPPSASGSGSGPTTGPSTGGV